MKRIVTIAAIVLGMVAAAQVCKAENDTTLVKSSNIRWDVETTTSSKTGKTTTDVIVQVDGTWYRSNKTSYTRYHTIKKYGGQPCVVNVRNRSSKTDDKGRIVVL